MLALEACGLCAAPYGDALLHDIDFQLPCGEILGLIGPNGAGKSSLLHCLGGGLPISSGDLRLGGRALSGWHREERCRALAIQTQHASLGFPFTVEEVVLLGRVPHASGRAADLQVVEEVLRATDTAELRLRPYTRLSGGEKQRVQLARAVAQIWRPGDAPSRVLLLDEPAAALDLAHQRMVLDLAGRLVEDGVAIVIASHDCNLLAARADRLLVMRDGRQYAWGTPETVLSASMFREVFDAAVQLGTHPLTGRPLVIHP